MNEDRYHIDARGTFSTSNSTGGSVEYYGNELVFRERVSEIRRSLVDEIIEEAQLEEEVEEVEEETTKLLFNPEELYD